MDLACGVLAQGAANVSQFVGKPWNSSNEVPIREWLCQDRTPAENERFHMLGNIVVPAQAFTAVGILQQLLRVHA